MEEKLINEQTDNEDGQSEDNNVFRGEDFSAYFDALIEVQDRAQDQAQPQHQPEDVPLQIERAILTSDQEDRFKALAELIPPYIPYDAGSIRRGAGAFAIATIVSMTGLKVAGRYAGIWATTFGWSGGFLVVVSAGSNIFANIFVRSTRVIWAYNRLKLMGRRWDDNRMPLPDDNFIKTTIKAQAFISFVAALPWFALVFQDLPQEWLPWLGWVFVVSPLTLIVEGSLALCSLTDYFDFDHQRKEAVYQWKRKMLVELRNLMTAETRKLYTMELLERAAHGEVYLVDPDTREFRENVGKVMAFLASPYSCIVGYGIYRLALSYFGTNTGPCQFEWVLNGGFFNTLLNMGTTAITFISGGTRFFLLSVANRRLFNRVLAARDVPLFNINGYNVVKPLVENQRMQKVFDISNIIWIFVCLFIGFFSVGTAGGLSLKNLYCEMATFISLFTTLCIALGGAFSVNTESVYTTLKMLMIEFIKYWITRSATYNVGERFGEDMDEFALIASHNIASMDYDTVEEKHLNTYDTGFTGSDEVASQRGLTNTQILALTVNRRVGIYPSRSDNENTQNLQMATQGILRTGQVQFFPDWRRDQNVNQYGQRLPAGLRHRNRVFEAVGEFEDEGVPLSQVPPSVDKFGGGGGEGIDRGAALEEKDDDASDNQDVFGGSVHRADEEGDNNAQAYK